MEQNINMTLKLGQLRVSQKLPVHLKCQILPQVFPRILSPTRLPQEADATQLSHGWAQHCILAARIAPPRKHLHLIARR